ncbi:unnamed protein product [Triticum turgidum subsp. durum]|uniref:Uncharacterized protein n=1 Tax=Triticum turgidum subsp. durum TaxID=4567 RepID=A0A9R1PAM3_TRITD|nr:unnamed protein product [Triticum turgidum subsp. durum]
MADEDAAALVKGKRITVVGSGKSAFEIAAECADANGAGTPCTMLCQNPHWLLLSGDMSLLFNFSYRRFDWMEFTHLDRRICDVNHNFVY